MDNFVDARNAMNGQRTTNSRRVRVSKLARSTPKKKQTRKVSAYQKRFGINLKKLKKAHPRTNISILMKKAHRMTRRDMR